MKVEKLLEQYPTQLSDRIKAQYLSRKEIVDKRVQELQDSISRGQEAYDKAKAQPHLYARDWPRIFEETKRQLARLQAEKQEIDRALATNQYQSQFKDTVADRDDRDAILYAAKKYLGGNYKDSDEEYSYDIDVEVVAGPRGGIMLKPSGEIKTDYVNGRYGWGSYDSARLPDRIFLYPHKNNLVLYAPETQQKTVLGPLSNVIDIIKNFDLLDPNSVKQITGRGEDEGWNPYER